MKKPELHELTLREKIGQTAVAYPAIDLVKEKLPFGTAWSVGGVKMAFVNMDFTPRDDLVMKADEYIETVKLIDEGKKVPIISAMDCMYGISGAFYEFRTIAASPLIGSANDEELAYSFGRIRARQLRRAGARWWWGPEIDIVSRDSKISYIRPYSDDPERIARMAVADMKGCQSLGVAATAKHFPGADGLEPRDPHTSYQMIHVSYEEWKKKQGAIFQKLFDEGVHSVMMAHTSFPAYDNTKVNGKYIPASASKKIINDLVKGEMGFKGVVITDAVKMLGLSSMFGDLKKVYIECLKAGNDAILGVDADYIDVIEEAVKEGEISEERINDACQRMLDMKEKLGMFSDEVEEYESIEDINKETERINTLVCEKGLCLEKDIPGFLPVSADKIKNVAVVAISPDTSIKEVLENGMGKEFAKRGINTTVVRNLYSYEEINKLAEENDLIVYVGARVGKFKYFGVDERESYNFILHSGAEKSIGVSFGDPYICFDEFTILDTFINAFNLTPDAQKAVVRGILGEIPMKYTGAFNVVPEALREYEDFRG